MTRTKLAALLALLLSVSAAFGSAYQASPKLVVILVIDQFRGDYLERYRDQFGEGGFRHEAEQGGEYE
jgi:predicted AlkP superfamily pyrophosphatase or phosphodiesterase